MASKNLGWKFAFVGVLAVLSIYSIWAKELRQGIDLKGGHILTFEIDTGQKQREQIDKEMAALTAQLQAASQPAEQTKLNEEVTKLKERRDQAGKGAESSQLIQDVISRLKKRIDPNGLYMLEWKPVGRNRFEVRMPLGTSESLDAKQKYLRLLESLQDDNIQRSEIQKISTLAEATPVDQAALAAAIKQVAGNDASRQQTLEKMTQADQARIKAKAALDKAKATPTTPPAALAKVQSDYDDSLAAYDAAVRDVLNTNINIEKLGQTLDQYVSNKERSNIPVAEQHDRERAFREGLKEMYERHPDRKAQIEQVVNGYKDWSERRTGLDDPSDLKRLIAKAGVLEFRIAPTLPDSKRAPQISEAELTMYDNQLNDQGPLAGRSRNDPYQWFEVHTGTERFSPDVILRKYAGKRYILLSNQEGFTILQSDPNHPWSLNARPGSDQMNKEAINFSLDPRGANLMGTLTTAHKGQEMAILLDDQVYSAPTIQSSIFSEGQITGQFTHTQVTELVNTLEAGALEGRVNDQPVSEKTIAPSMGEENRSSGIRAALYSFIAVAAFMVVYYLLAGSVADAAMFLNLLLVLGAMSFVEAVFTLPGIAGLTLSVAMAVDSNVLIYERIREEQAKTLSLRMAIRNAYSEAFTAIIDTHATTLITAIILLWVGTEEVKGFAITLGLGVLFNLFTAVAVTRWVFEWLMNRNLLKTKVTMLRLIHVPNIDWMGMRWYGWIFSIIITLLGITALLWQGNNIWGIEFSSGTEASFRFKPAAMIQAGNAKAYPTREAVEEDLANTAKAMKVQDEKDLAQLTSELASAQGEKKDDLAKQVVKLKAQADDLQRFVDSVRVETLLAGDKANDFLTKYDANKDGAIEKDEIVKAGMPESFYEYLDAAKSGKVTRDQLAKRLPERTFQFSTTIPTVDTLRKVVRDAFGDALDTPMAVKYDLQTSGPVAGLNVTLDPKDEGMTLITPELGRKVRPDQQARFIDFTGGAMFVIQNMDPPLNEAALAERIQTMRLQPDFAGFQFNRSAVMGLTPAANGEGFTSFAVLSWNPNIDFAGRPAEWKSFATNELNLLKASLARSETLESVSSFDSSVAKETKRLAVIATVMSWLAIIVYLWFRFGKARWGVAAVLCLVHDVLISIGLIAISDYLATTWLGPILLINVPIKIDMTVIAAFLTIIGYSVCDTIVVFDRIRENRGKLKEVDATMINHAINQTLSRTLLTSFTVIMALFIMYVWGGPGIHPFCYAMLGGVLIGTYSSIAVASPMLLGFKTMMSGRSKKALATTSVPTGK